MNDHNVYHFNDDWWGEESLSSQKGGIGADVVGGFGHSFLDSRNIVSGPPGRGQRAGLETTFFSCIVGGEDAYVAYGTSFPNFYIDYTHLTPFFSKVLNISDTSDMNDILCLNPLKNTVSAPKPCDTPSDTSDILKRTQAGLVASL